MKEYLELKNVYASWKQMAQNTIDKLEKIELEIDIEPEKIDKIVIFGVGGSGIIGDYMLRLSVSYLFDKPIIPNKSIQPSVPIAEDTLVISISYSGNTMETLLSTHEALKNNAKVIGITSGGRLSTLLEERGQPVISLPKGYLPRAGFPLLLYSAVGLLAKLKLSGYLSWGSIKNSIEILSNVDETERMASTLAGYLVQDVPIIVSCWEYYPVALRMRQEIAENAKKVSFIEELPDAGHNSVVAWRRNLSKNPVVTVLGSSKKCEKLIEAFTNAINCSPKKLLLKGSDNLQELVWGAWISGFISLDMALRSKINPIETDAITIYKDVIRGIEDL